MTDATGTPPRAESIFRQNLRNFAFNRLAVASTVVVLIFIVMAIFAPLIAPHDPNETDLFRRLQPPAWQAGGEWSYLLGCDGLGRDILSRIIFGTRISIFIGAAVILVATTIGILAGLASGYLRGWVDVVISRLVDILLGFPYLIFAIGPADGFTQETRHEADLAISFGKITLSHELARVVLLEQLYRGFTILHGHPYHAGH